MTRRVSLVGVTDEALLSHLMVFDGSPILGHTYNTASGFSLVAGEEFLTDLTTKNKLLGKFPGAFRVLGEEKVVEVKAEVKEATPAENRMMDSPQTKSAGKRKK